MKFEAPEMKIVHFDVEDILTTSNWDLPFVPNESEPEETGWETPMYP